MDMEADTAFFPRRLDPGSPPGAFGCSTLCQPVRRCTSSSVARYSRDGGSDGIADAAFLFGAAAAPLPLAGLQTRLTLDAPSVCYAK